MRNVGALHRYLRIALGSVFFWMLIAPVYAHDTPVALLTLKETSPGTFVERWTFSSSTINANPTPIYPEHCRRERPQVFCGDLGLSGEFSIEKLGEVYSATVVRLVPRQGPKTSFTVTAATPSMSISSTGQLSWVAIASAYIPLGFEHILLGIDHLLFVLGLILLVRSPMMLLKTITAFTIAHSLTLAAATFGWIGVPEPTINALVALSIVFVAIDVLKLREGYSGFSVRWPWAIAFGFGLLHGFGFAGALSGIGLSAENLPAALLFFNVGVELGQLAFVVLVLALFQAHRQINAVLPDWAVTAGVYLMGTAGSVWFVGRMVDLIEPLYA
ncbi:MAG: HupE/UreJ family protein [Pseudomonadota bacterium]